MFCSEDFFLTGKVKVRSGMMMHDCKGGSSGRKVPGKSVKKFKVDPKGFDERILQILFQIFQSRLTLTSRRTLRWDFVPNLIEKSKKIMTEVFRWMNQRITTRGFLNGNSLFPTYGNAFLGYICISLMIRGLFPHFFSFFLISQLSNAIFTGEKLCLGVGKT